MDREAGLNPASKVSIRKKKKCLSEGGEMTQRLKAQAATSKDPSLISSVHIGWGSL